MNYSRITAAALAGAAFAVGNVAQATADTITFSSWGGAYQEAQRQAFLDPAEEALGITIAEDSHTGLAATKTQVLSGNVYWDVVDLAVTDCQRGERDGIWEKLDYSQIPNADDIPDEFKTDYWVGLITYSTVLGWNTDTVTDNVPQNWTEFFDVENFPGKRTMRNSARESLEVALMADGVAPEDLYPLDVDRAYEKLEEIEPHIGTWWTSGAQSAQLVADGSVDYAALWNGRIHAAIEDGANADFHWEGAILQVECLVVPEGTQNKDLAMQVINESLAPENQAHFSTIIPYGPVNPAAFDTGIVSEEAAAGLPTSEENLARSAVLNAEFWTSEEGERALERWERFTQQ